MTLQIPEINNRLRDRSIEIIEKKGNRIGVFKCLRCGNIWEKLILTILKKDSGCRACRKLGRPVKDIFPELLKRNLKLLVPYTTLNKKYKILCTKHNVTYERNLCNYFDHLKSNPNLNLCRICRKEERINSLKNKCLELELLEYKNDSEVTWTCKHCGHTFKRSGTEVLRGGWEGCNDCPECGYDRKKRFLNKVFDSFDTYKEQVTLDTDWVNNKYLQLVSDKEHHIAHRCSIYDCYRHCIPVWMCSSPINLELKTGDDNLKKSRNSDLSISELVLRFSEWVLSHPEYLLLIPK